MERLRKRNDRQIKEVRVADARWLNLDTGDVIEQSYAEQELLHELEALRRQVELLRDNKERHDEPRFHDTSTLDSE